MLNYLRARMPLAVKFYIKSLLVLFSGPNLKSFWQESSKEKKRQIVTFFELLTPYDTEYPLKRIGHQEDGGYLLPDYSVNWDLVISPGVGETIASEKEIRSMETKVVLIDGTIDPPNNLPEKFLYLPMLVGKESDPSLGIISLNDLVDLYAGDYKNVLLQMDIEGAEWDVLESVSEQHLSRFSVIILEVHNIDRLLDPLKYDLSIEVLGKLLRNHFISHFHVNNAGGYFFFRGKRFPKVVELTLVSESSFRKVKTATVPHDLDRPCSSQIHDWKLRWRRNL